MTGVLGSVLDLGDRNSLGNAGVGLFLDIVVFPSTSQKQN
jgi:hypothetical protein